MENINGNQPNKPLTDLKNGRISLGFVLTAMMLVLVGLTGIVPTSLQSLAILGVMTMMAFTGEVYLVYPIMLFYGYRLGTLAGVTVYRWYTMLFLGITFLRSRSIKLNVKQLLVFGLFGIYCLAAICPWSLRSGIFAVLDMAGILVLITAYLKQPDKLKYFFTVYVLCAFVAYFTGTRLEGLQYNAVIGGEYVELVRNMSTFEDPNYMGYFYTGAVFAVVGLKLFKPWLRVLTVVALYAMLLTTLSVTAIVVNAVLWLFYLWITKSLNPKTLIFILVIVAAGIGLYQYGLHNPGDPVVGVLSMRIREKLMQAEAGDLGSATSSRSDLAIYHLQYFISQPIHKMLIGMNAASALRIDLDGYRLAAHNEYVDWLLNVGIIGTCIMLYYLASTIYRPLKNYRRDRTDRTALTVLMFKMVFVLYAFTLTLYGDYRFMLFMLI